MLTIHQAIQIGVRHALSGGTSSDELQERDILNFAGKHLVGMHRWNWLGGQLGETYIVAGQEWLDLPPDCVEIEEEGAQFKNTDASYLTGVSLAEIQAMRRSNFSPPYGTFWYAPGYRDTEQLSTDGRGRRMVLELYPTAEDGSSLEPISVRYRSGWTDITGQRDENEFLPLAADGRCDTLYIGLVRAFAKGLERDVDYDLATELAKCQPLFEAARAADTRAASFRGVPMNTAMQVANVQRGSLTGAHTNPTIDYQSS